MPAIFNSSSNTSQTPDERTDDTTWQQFAINYQYPVIFTEDLFSTHNYALRDAVTLLENDKQHRLSVFIDEGVLDACPSLVCALSAYVDKHSSHMAFAGDPTIMKSGEGIKSDPARLSYIQNIIAEQHIDRHSFVIAIGGGALLDTVGLVAATSHRGIRHIRIPTTVLAQNDSGVGVKNGVNAFGQKNYQGTFTPPFAVLNDYDFIDALPERDKVAGMAEAVKVALIRDTLFYRWLEDNASALSRFDKLAMQYMIRRCAELHMHQIAHGGDPFERGSARPLDFGHWAAHRLELLTGYMLRHGEAVAIGIALDSRYSVCAGLLRSGEDSRICRLLETLGFTLWHQELESRTPDGTLKVIEGLTDFKEHLGGELTITLLQDIGMGIEVNDLNDDDIEQSIEWLKHGKSEPSAKVLTITTAHRQQQMKTQSAAKTRALMNRDLDIDLGSVAATDTHNVDGSKDVLNNDSVIQHLQSWLFSRLTKKELNWLYERTQLLQKNPVDRDLHITLGLIPRKLSRAELKLTTEEMLSVHKACGRSWDPVDWTIDTAARCLVICILQREHPENFLPIFTELCKTAELQESMAFYGFTAILPQSLELDTLIGAGLRTHIRTIFDAIAHNNPYPKQHFDENRWNHMILKALFIDSTLWPIQGIDERANAELALILCDYAHERWAAGRPVTPELWRCVGPFAKGTMLDDLFSVLNARELHTQAPLSRQAALLALHACPELDQQSLKQQHPVWYAQIDSGALTWNTIGHGALQTLAA